MNRKTKLSFVILFFALLLPIYSSAEVWDSSPTNFWWAKSGWDYRDYNNYGTSHFTGGSQLKSGASVQIECEIKTGGFLDKIEDVIWVVAINDTEDQKLYYLHYNPFVWMGSKLEYWSLNIQPADFMFEGNWLFVLVYQGSDAQIHFQSYSSQPPNQAFPPPISHVTLGRTIDSFVLSWNGIGDPNALPINYLVRIFEAGAGGDWIVDIRGDWDGGGTLVTGSYDAVLNKVIFSVPGMYGGEAYGIRLETRNAGNRSLYYMILPSFSP
jgi:hypothetical protein